MTGRYRALRFAGAGSGTGGGLGLVTTTTGALSTVEDDESIRQAIMLLLGTRPGERLMRPGYGSYLHRLAFAPNDHTTAGLAIHYVRQAIGRWEPRVEIVELDAQANPADPARLDIHLTYRTRASLTESTVEFAFELSPRSSGGGA